MLVTSSGVCKLGDFGCSVGVDSGDVPLGKHSDKSKKKIDMLTFYCPPPGNVFLVFLCQCGQN